MSKICIVTDVRLDSDEAELQRMLHEAGILYTECEVRVLWPHPFPRRGEALFYERKTDATAGGASEVFARYPKPELLPEIDRLKQELASLRPNLIIAVGEEVLWALTNNSGITRWRGSELSIAGQKIIPIYHPSKIRVKWEWRFITVQDLRRCAREAEYPELRIPETDFLVRPSFPAVMVQLNHWIGLAESEGPLRLAVDIETRTGHISCIGFAASPTRAMCVPFMDISREDGYWSPEEEVEIVWAIRELLTHPRVQVVGQNFLYDMQYIAKHWGFAPRLTFDTMYMHHVAFAGLQKGLDFLSSMYGQHHQYWKDEGKKFDPRYHDEERHWVYNCKDCVVTYEVSFEIEATIASLGLEAPAAIQSRLIFTLFRMMLRGVRVDLEARQKMNMELFDAIHERELWLYEVGEGIVPVPKTKGAAPWYKSPAQLKTFFYDVLGLPVQKNRKTRKPSTDDDALAVLRKREPALRQLFDKISEIRSLGVFLNTFIRAPLDHDNRMRCSYNPAGTETYRLNSSSDAFGFGTNLQNIPSGNED